MSRAASVISDIARKLKEASSPGDHQKIIGAFESRGFKKDEWRSRSFLGMHRWFFKKDDHVFDYKFDGRNGKQDPVHLYYLSKPEKSFSDSMHGKFHDVDVDAFLKFISDL